MKPLPPLAQIERLLIVKTSSLGDVIHALPAVQALKEAKPGLTLGWAVRRRCADILRGNPHIEHLYVLDDKPTVGELSRLRKSLHMAHYEMALDMQGLALSGLVTRLSGAPIRVGWDRNRECNALFLTHPVVPGKVVQVGIRHEVDLLYGFVHALGVEMQPGEFPPQPYLADEGRDKANGWLCGLPRPRLALNVGAARAYKRWPTEHWAELARIFLQKGFGLVFVGDKHDATTVAEIRALLTPTQNIVDVAGHTTLRQLASVLAACDLVVSGDTGPMHLAVAVGTPVVALFGATDPRRHGPYGSSNIVLSDAASVTAARPTEEQGIAAMRAILPARVLEAVEAKFAGEPHLASPQSRGGTGQEHEVNPSDSSPCSEGEVARNEPEGVPKCMRKILVVNMNYMGDALLTTPALSALRRAYPDAQIDTVVGAGAAAQVLEGSPDLDNIIARTAPGSWARCAQIFSLLREGRYSDAIILPPLPAYAAAAFFAGTRRRVGLAGRGMNRFLTQLRPTQAVHMADAMLDTMPIPPDDHPTRRRLSVTVARDDLEAAERLLVAAGCDLTAPLIAVNVGATRPQKRWFAESFAETLDLLGDVQSVLVGAGEHDDAVADDILRRVQKANSVNLVGRTSVKQLAAVLARCDLLLSADSGPMHLATAVGTPTVALFGSTDPAATGPYDGVSRVLYKALPCAPCGNHPTCGGRYDCLRAITPGEVALAVRALLRERRPSLVALLPLIAQPLLPRRGDGGPEQQFPTLTPTRERVASLSEPGEGTTAAPIHRILIATKFRFIGDTLLAIPIFRAARAQWPHAHIALLTGKNARLLLQNNPYLDEIIEFDPYSRDRGTGPYLRLVRRLRRGRFDLCLALNRSFHSALTPWLAGARIRAGFKSEGRGPLLNRRVDYDREKSEIACYFDVLRAVAPRSPVNPALELWVSDAERQAVAARLRASLGEECSRLRLIGIQPGASIPGKRWPPERFAAVADALAADDPQARIILVGGPDEAESAHVMLAHCAPETQARTVNFTGAFDLRGSLAVISRLRLFVGNDTAVMHSAVALSVPTVALFGPTNPRKWGNYGPCHRVLEAPGGVMEVLEASQVVAAARELRRA